VLGQCAPGRTNVEVQAQSLFGDNPRYSTQPIADAASPAVTASVAHLYLQAVLVKARGGTVVERVRTYLVTHTGQSQSGTAARTFGEAVQARGSVASTVQRLIDIAVVLTLIVAGGSLAVAVGGSVIERKRPFTLLRLTGTSLRTLNRVMLLEATLPLAAAVVVAAVLGYLIAALTVIGIAPAGTPVPLPGHLYYLMMGGGLIGALAVICAALPLLGRVTAASSVRFE
jgi:predicted lysophospholipase L1 biosynthesis ABC-type transport system permease subunit